MILYDEPAEIYHANPALGSSLLRDFIRSPRLYRDKVEGLTRSDETAAMKLGTLFHLAILEPARFAETVTAKPEGMNFATKEGKLWKETEENSGKTIISFKEMDMISRSACRMPASVSQLFSEGAAEVTFRNALSGTAAQCRADYWNEKTGAFYDLKTINVIEKIDRSIFDRGYFIQMRWYQRIIEVETGQKPQARLIFAETAAPYRWRTVLLDSAYIEMADREIDEALRGIAQCEKDGDWSDNQKEIHLASPPSWTQEFTENEEGSIDL